MPPTLQTDSRPSAQPAQRQWLLPLSLLVWLGTYFAARYGVELTLARPALQIAIALSPLIPTAVLLWALSQKIRSLDELERRIQLEALAIAFPLCVVLLWTLGLVELAIKLDPANWSHRHVWAMFPVFYFIGLAFARRRYT